MSKSKKSKVKIVEIKRSRWAMADNFEKRSEDTCLRDSTGMQCCLGFVTRALGAKCSEIEGAWLPSQVNRFVEDKFDWLRALETEAAAVNDSDAIKRPERERKLKELFKSAPVRLKFVP